MNEFSEQTSNGFKQLTNLDNKYHFSLSPVPFNSLSDFFDSIEKNDTRRFIGYRIHELLSDLGSINSENNIKEILNMLICGAKRDASLSSDKQSPVTQILNSLFENVDNSDDQSAVLKLLYEKLPLSTVDQFVSDQLEENPFFNIIDESRIFFSSSCLVWKKKASTRHVSYQGFRGAFKHLSAGSYDYKQTTDYDLQIVNAGEVLITDRHIYIHPDPNDLESHPQTIDLNNIISVQRTTIVANQKSIDRVMCSQPNSSFFLESSDFRTHREVNNVEIIFSILKRVVTKNTTNMIPDVAKITNSGLIFSGDENLLSMSENELKQKIFSTTNLNVSVQITHAINFNDVDAEDIYVYLKTASDSRSVHDIVEKNDKVIFFEKIVLPLSRLISNLNIQGAAEPTINIYDTLRTEDTKQTTIRIAEISVLSFSSFLPLNDFKTNVYSKTSVSDDAIYESLDDCLQKARAMVKSIDTKPTIINFSSESDTVLAFSIKPKELPKIIASFVRNNELWTELKNELFLAYKYLMEHCTFKNHFILVLASQSNLLTSNIPSTTYDFWFKISELNTDTLDLQDDNQTKAYFENISQDINIMGQYVIQSTSPHSQNEFDSTGADYDKLRKLKELLDDNIITEQDFEKAKSQILGLQ